MDQLIPIINELQDTYSKLKIPFIDLPQIVIIGSQSAGKSSVLENIVRQEFLPRGTGIVTRCPLILHLVHDPDSTKETRGRFLHKGDVDYYDFNHIKEEIIRQTEILAGPEKNISNQPITLKIYSYEFPNLTLIDLPGLTKVAVESQPRDIDQQIRNTCLKFAQKENSIILAVSTANQDLANSDSLRFSEELDPEGKRTLCVITKLDLMDRGTDAYQILTGKILPKQLGYIGVVSRSQEDIMRGKSIDEALCDERRFFAKHYPDLAKTSGTMYLAQRLNMLLKQHIQKCLPTLRETIKDKIKDANNALDLIGPEIKDKRAIIPQFICNFTKAYSDINDGIFEDRFHDIRGGALISDIIYQKFPKILNEIDVEKYLTDEVIMGAVKNCCASDPMNFSRQKAFICLVQEQIQKLFTPSMNCIDEVYETMKDFVKHASKAFPFSNFPNMINRIIHETNNLIRQSFKNTKNLVDNIISSEKTDVCCSNPNYKLGFALKNMNFENYQINECGYIGGKNDNNESIELLIKGFEIACQNVAQNIEIFDSFFLHFIEESGFSMSIINVFQSNINLDEKKLAIDGIIENMFQAHPSLLPSKNAILAAMFDVNLGFLEKLINSHLNEDLTKLTELRRPVKAETEVQILRSLVKDYFNIVRQNIIYFVPKFIKTFLVIHVRNKLINHLQMIYSDGNLDFLLQEDESTHKQRMKYKTLLEELEVVKQRIDNIYYESI